MSNETMNGMSNEHVTYEKKYLMKEGNDYASKGVANTALGLGIGALGLQVLNNNNNGNGLLGGLLGGNNNKTNEELFGIYKGYRDSDDAILAKHNADSFSLYQANVNSTANLQSQVDELKTQIAIEKAVEPWRTKAIYDAIALEAERRSCADCNIVNYSNQMFVPNYIADLTPATTSVQRATYNPLACVNQGCGCSK